MFRKEWLVYKYENKCPELDIVINSVKEKGLDICEATINNIDRFFCNDNPRKYAYKYYVKRGCFGVILYRKDEWVAYAFMTKPYLFGTPHLPRWLKNMDYYWIFNCHTKMDSRGKGLFKIAIQLLVNKAFQQEDMPEIYIDAEPNNYPSRQAITSVGFNSKGVFICYTLNIPMMGGITWGTWARDQEHSK